MRLSSEPQPYVTRLPHLHYPAGTKCMASRPDKLLVLTFEDGEVLTMGPGFYAEGLEDPGVGGTTGGNVLVDAAFDIAMADICAVEDKKAFDAIDAALKP